MRASYVFLWVFCLTMVAVGARNFELGLSSDGPIYSTIARNIIESQDWFWLESSVPDYKPYFADHPHLGIWLLAISFKLFGAKDFAARIPGHIFYFGFLSLLFFYIRKKTNEKTAFLTLFFLWIWGRFSNSFSAVYLDPGVHFFGFSAVILLENAIEKNKFKTYFFSGLFFAFVLLMKGLTILGYAPVILFLTIRRFLKPFTFKEIQQALCGLFLGVALPLSLYVIALKASSTPEFFQVYWSHQVTNRFAKIASVDNFFSLHFWKPLFEDTSYYSLLALLALPKIAKTSALQLITLIAGGFILLYAPNRCSGAHYFIPIIPFFAFGLALLVAPYFKFSVENSMRVLCGVCILAIFIIQYIPVRTHGMPPTQGEEFIFSLHKKKNVQTLWIDGTPYYTDFINSSRYTWWGHVNVLYVTNGAEIPPAKEGFAYLLFWEKAFDLRKQALGNKGWCLLRRFSERSVWMPCPVDTSEHLETVYEK